MTDRSVVHLLRHGEVHNPSKVLYGRLPGFRLSPLGEQMALLAADALAGRDVVRVVSSPLERARQTAAPVADRFDLPVDIDDRLIESENVFEGLRVGVGDGILKSPRHYRHLTNPFRPSGGEPYAAVAARVLAACAAARDAARGHEAVLVSHQLPIWVTRRFVEGRTLWHRPDRRQCGLASVTSFTYDGDRIVTVTYSEPAGELARTPSVPGA